MERVGERENRKERDKFFSSFFNSKENNVLVFYKAVPKLFIFHTLKICILFAKQIATQSGAAEDHCSPQISAPAE